VKGNIFYSLSFQKKKSEYSKSELLPLILNYYYKGKKLRQSTELKVKIKDWNLNKTEGEWVKKGDESFENKNVILQKKLNDFNNLDLTEIKIPFALWNPKNSVGAFDPFDIYVDNIYWEP